MAVYSDLASLSRSLLVTLTTEPPQDADEKPAGQQLLLPHAAMFWTEHSDCCGLASWASAAEVPKDRRDFLGRWGAGGGSDHYVRTLHRVVEGIQVQMARLGREMVQGGPDHFGVEETLSQLERFLASRGVEPDEARKQSARLTCADTSLAVVRAGARARQPKQRTPRTLGRTSLLQWGCRSCS